MHRQARHGWSVALAAVLLTIAGCGSQGSVVTRSPADPTTSGTAGTSDQLPVVVGNLDPCPTSSEEPSSSEDRLANITLPCLIDGPSVNLRRLRGPMVINLWATWCGPCRKEMPILQAAHARERDRVQFLGVDTQDDPERAGAFLEEVDATYPQIVDLEGELLADTRSPGLPVTIVLDRDGTVVTQHVGAVTEETLTSLIEDAGR